MPLVNISSADNISGIRLKEQASSPTTPPSGYAQLYVNTTPAVQFEDDAGTVRTLSDTTHVHTIANVTNLQTTLDGKASSVHTHAIADVTALQTTLDGKASSVHTHAIADVTNLQTTLDGKASSTHTHAIADVTNLQTTLDGKASSTHTHAAADITSGTLDNARVNWAAPSAIGGTTPAQGTFTNVIATAANPEIQIKRSTSNASNRAKLRILTDSLDRWIIQTTTTEGGTNTGSDLRFGSYDDSGVFLAGVLSLNRSDGFITALPTYSKTITTNVRDLQIDDAGVLGYVASARKHKHKIRPIKETNRFLAKLRKLNPVRYRYKVDGDGDGVVDDLLTHYGFVAEEVEEVFPELCSYDIVPDEGAEIIRDENGKLDPSVPTHKELATLNYSEMHAIAIAGLQHALDKIDELEAKVKELERRLVRLEVKA